MNKRLENKTALITGAASGIGKATAKLFAQEGAALVLSDLNEAGLKQTVEECQSINVQVKGVVADVSQAQQCRHLVEEGILFAKVLDIVVNIAGVGSFNKTVEHTEEAEWDYIMSTNLKSVFMVSKFAIPHLRSRGGGPIINMASPHAFQTSEGLAPYAASKGAVMALSRQMAFDLVKDRIRVNAIVPGATDTPMLRLQAAQQGVSLGDLGFHADQTKIGRIALPDEVAKGILWLASDDSLFVNAAPLFIDGGLTARL